MARPSSNTKTTRVDVKETVGDTVTLQPRTPIVSNARSGGAEAAFALAEALKGATTLGEMRNQKKSSQAQVDFQRGAVDEGEDNQAYRRTVESLKARARWIEDEAAFDEAFEDIDKRNLSIDDLNTALDNIFATKYADLDDPWIANQVLPRMEKYRQKKIDEVLEIQDEAELAETGTALTQIAEDAYQKGLQADGGLQFDYEGLHDSVQDVLPGGEGNETYFEIIKDIAIRNGDVAFIRNVPERWPDGTPTFMSDPRYNERVLDAENRALGKAAAIEKARQEAEADKIKEDLRIVSMASVDAAANGDFDTANSYAEMYRGLPDADPTKAIALQKAADSLVNTFGEREGNQRFIGAIYADVYAGRMDDQAIYESFAAGEFGEGKVATRHLRDALAIANSVENQARAQGNAAKDYSVYANSIRDAYRPDRIVGKYDETLATTQNAALREYHQLTQGGMSPFDANAQIREKYDKNLAGSSFATINKAYTAETAAIEFATGNMSSYQFEEFGGTEDTIAEMVDRNIISPEKGKALLQQL